MDILFNCLLLLKVLFLSYYTEKKMVAYLERSYNHLPKLCNLMILKEKGQNDGIVLIYKIILNLVLSQKKKTECILREFKKFFILFFI